MKRLILVTILTLTLSAGLALAQRGGAPPAPQNSGPGVPIVQAFLNAYNKQDVAAIQKMVTADVLFMDDDGHMIQGKDTVGGILQRRLTATPAEKLVVSGAINSSGTADVVWAGFPYVFDKGDTHRKGLITMIFRKAGADWQIAHFHFSIDQVAANSLDRR
jgi:ketosteroid isomerase-like protein